MGFHFTQLLLVELPPWQPTVLRYSGIFLMKIQKTDEKHYFNSILFDRASFIANTSPDFIANLLLFLHTDHL